MVRYLGLGGGGGGRTTDSRDDVVPDETVVVGLPGPEGRNTNTNAASADAATPYDRQEEYAAEEIVLMGAFWSEIDESFWSPMYQYVTGTTAQLIQPVTAGPLLRGSIGVTHLSGGIGIWGYWNGIYSRPSISTSRIELPSSRTTWTMALMGGASAGLILLGRSYLRSTSVATTESATEDSSPDDAKKKQK
jgi:hypothetical protein